MHLSPTFIRLSARSLQVGQPRDEFITIHHKRGRIIPIPNSQAFRRSSKSLSNRRWHCLGITALSTLPDRSSGTCLLSPIPDISLISLGTQLLVAIHGIFDVSFQIYAIVGQLLHKRGRIIPIPNSQAFRRSSKSLSNRRWHCLEITALSWLPDRSSGTCLLSPIPDISLISLGTQLLVAIHGIFDVSFQIYTIVGQLLIVGEILLPNAAVELEMQNAVRCPPPSSNCTCTPCF
ncbi:hypothetical protein DFH09DRAFT_577019 [Mycena vulgaris]|nr:hypothetical protein DFH09DRAFT_577019 [Mycena vulgaris]